MASIWEHFLYTAPVGNTALGKQDCIAHVAIRWDKCLGSIFC
jgi:hypothetical protein